MGGREKKTELKKNEERGAPPRRAGNPPQGHMIAGSMQNVSNYFLAIDHTAPLYAKHCLVNSDTHGGHGRKQALLLLSSTNAPIFGSLFGGSLEHARESRGRGRRRCFTCK